MNTHKVKRDGLPPIAFTGETIGIGSNEYGTNGRANRWTNITLYRTQGGRYVGQIESRTCWQGERDRDSAKSFATAAELIEWLGSDNGGELGSVSQEAVEKAAKVDPAFATAWVEEVE